MPKTTPRLISPFHTARDGSAIHYIANTLEDAAHYIADKAAPAVSRAAAQVGEEISALGKKISAYFPDPADHEPKSPAVAKPSAPATQKTR